MSTPKHWVIVPAAGIGARMQASIPKQYLQLDGMTILERTLSIFCQSERFEKVVVPIAEHDSHWSGLAMSGHKKILVCDGGAERSDSVLNALYALEKLADDDDWVWVHDAARPCLSSTDIVDLGAALSERIPGALLAVPIVDTVKRADDQGCVVDTVDRQGLWRAMTPQVFRVGELRSAIERCVRDDVVMTDEASAMEYCGYSPLLVTGSDLNIKITRPEDLKRAMMNLAKKQDG